VTTRRRFLTGAALTAGAVVAGWPVIVAPGSAAETIGFALPQGFSADFIDIMNAYSGGHFARQGIEATVIGATSGAQAMQFLVAGRAQFARGSALDEMIAAARATPPVAIATINQGSSFRLVSLRDRAVPNAEDLRGKTVGVIANGSTTETFIDLMLAKVGIPKREVQRQAVGGTPGAIEFLKKGRVDCFITSLSVVVTLERAGENIVYWDTARYVDMPGQVYMTTAEVMATKPDLVVRCLKALKASVDELMTQPTAPIFERAAKDFDIPGLADMASQVAYLKLAIATQWLARGRENLLINLPKVWESGVAALRDAGIADVKDPASLYTNRFIDEALKG
jgi:ABC-type nitrate/sulfonate/bicarbonate transport system substrate-binding protein